MKDEIVLIFIYDKEIDWVFYTGDSLNIKPNPTSVHIVLAKMFPFFAALLGF